MNRRNFSFRIESLVGNLRLAAAQTKKGVDSALIEVAVHRSYLNMILFHITDPSSAAASQLLDSVSLGTSNFTNPCLSRSLFLYARTIYSISDPHPTLSSHFPRTIYLSIHHSLSDLFESINTELFLPFFRHFSTSTRSR